MKKLSDKKSQPVIARASRSLTQTNLPQTLFTIEESQRVKAGRLYLDMRDLSKFLNKLVDIEQIAQEDVLFYKKLREYVHYQISISPPQQRWDVLLSIMRIWKSEIRRGFMKDKKLLEGVVLLAEQILHGSTVPIHVGTVIVYDSDSLEYVLYFNQWE